MSRRRYIATETAIGATISLVISVVVAALVLGGDGPVHLVGRTRSVAVDAVPQTLFVTAAAIGFPLAVARRRGVLSRRLSLARIWTGSLLAGAAAAVVAFGLHAALLPADTTWSVPVVLGWKALYAVLLAVPVSAAVLDRLLVDGGTWRSRRARRTAA